MSLRWQRPHWPSCSRDCSKRLSSRCFAYAGALIPGGDLYYTTLALVQGDTAGFARYGTLFIEEAGAMAFGVILVAYLVQTRQAVAAARKKIRKRSVRGRRETAAR
ncbi:MAG: hypothetical protein ACLT4C_01080 [Butyricicoccus sp.]